MKEVIILKRILITMLCLILFLAACGNGDDSSKSNSKEDKGTKSYTTDDGSKVKIPKNPKRVLVLTANYGNFKKLGVKPIAITSVFPDSKYLNMDKIKKIDPEDVEAAAKLKPDLIITYKENKNNNETEVITDGSVKRKKETMIVILISSELSGTYQAAKLAKESVGYDAIYIIDSKTTVGALQILLYESVKLRNNGVDAQKIVETIEKLKEENSENQDYQG